jgi:hypothetical protein
LVALARVDCLLIAVDWAAEIWGSVRAKNSNSIPDDLIPMGSAQRGDSLQNFDAVFAAGVGRKNGELLILCAFYGFKALAACAEGRL